MTTIFATYTLRLLHLNPKKSFILNIGTLILIAILSLDIPKQNLNLEVVELASNMAQPELIIIL